MIVRRIQVLHGQKARLTSEAQLVQCLRPAYCKGSDHISSAAGLIIDRLARIPAQSLLGRAVRFPLRLIPRQSVLTVRSGINQGMRWIAHSGVHGYWFGHYEQEKQALVRRLVKPGMNVFDVGANAGFYTLAFSRLVGKTGHVWAFEPYAGNAVNLLRHLAMNEIANATVVQAAVSGQAGIVGLKTESSDSQWTISGQEGNYRVPTVALDSLIENGSLPVPDLIKMDVEGAESGVLDGAKRLIARRKTTFQIALHGDDQRRKCISLLNGAGYQAYRLDGQPVGADCQTDEIYASAGLK